MNKVVLFFMAIIFVSLTAFATNDLSVQRPGSGTTKWRILTTRL